MAGSQFTAAMARPTCTAPAVILAIVLLSLVPSVSAVHEQWPLAGGIVSISGGKTVPADGEQNVRVPVRFEEGTFSAKPHVVITSVTFADGSKAPVFQDQLSIQTEYFTVGFIADEPWAEPFTIAWTAAQQAAACRKQSDCPHSQYCDQLGGCDECVVCAALSGTDSVDQRCPDKCGVPENLSNQHVCKDETYPCGDACLMVVGNRLPQCLLKAGNAVCAGYDDYPGSLSAYPAGAEGLSLPAETIRSMKADLAYDKADTVDPHYASPALAVRVLEVQDEALCYTVTCEAEDQCNFASQCYNGICLAMEEKSNGLTCDDELDNTDEDKCAEGVCVGVDYCDTVTCKPKSQCHEAGECYRGVCTDPTVDNGKACDDGLELTDDDKCQDGVCIGTDFCVGVTCAAQSQCHEVGTCSHGVCSDLTSENGTECDDGLEPTDDDTCKDGVCTGVDYCANVVCRAESQCHGVGTCSHGVCSNPGLEVGSECDDGNPMTSFDQCTESGRCEGILQPTVGPDQDPDQYEVTTTITVPGGGEYKQDPNITDALKTDIADQLPGVDPDDVDVTWVNDTTIEVSVGTRPTNGDKRKAELDDVLNNGTFPNVENIAPDFDFEEDAPAVAVLNCLTVAECPVLDCGSGDVPYKSPYLSVQKCCAECIPENDVFAQEVRDYEKATDHWKKAQEEQDEAYRNGDLADYEEALTQYETEIDIYAREAVVWELIFDGYKSKEDTLYDITCKA